MGYRNREPCEHPGCLNHITHPCDGCGRIAGQKVLSDLLGCPFCKAHAAELFEEKPGWFSMLCNIEKGGCGARTGMYEDMEEPRIAWQTREEIK